MKAGEVIPVRFWTAGMNDKKDEKRLPTKKISQARHGGGLCEFSLSYDGGATYHVIGTYTKTCPDSKKQRPAITKMLLLSFVTSKCA
jgi:hypothetical protein